MRKRSGAAVTSDEVLDPGTVAALRRAQEHYGSPTFVNQLAGLFRAAHTIKGSAGLFSLDHIVSFTHVVESLLDQVRAGKLRIADALVGLLLSCRDHISALVEAVAAGQTQPRSICSVCIRRWSRLDHRCSHDNRSL